MAARQTGAAVDNEASSSPENIIVMCKQLSNSFNPPRTRSGSIQKTSGFLLKLGLCLGW